MYCKSLRVCACVWRERESERDFIYITPLSLV